MSDTEVIENIRFFTAGLRGPRTKPCRGLILSGVGVATRSDTPDAIRAARSEGIEWVVLHVGGEDLSTLDIRIFDGLIDTLVVPVQPESGALTEAGRAIAAARDIGIDVAANTALTANALPALVRTSRTIAKTQPTSMTFTYPFPINGNEATTAPTPARALSALRPALHVIDDAGVKARIKGLAACHLGEQAHRLAKTENRYYVDADHQQAEALLFFPDVVRFFKDEPCRFCTLNGDCDGFFSTYLRRPGFPPLQPVEAS